ncbi:Antitoxin component YwqK of the YwqJK toxin-antitoxin module [Soonwooa buanensis]|uniref:Antitoxin component YwqK of the YwqJK toxin-antitoxin module n=1 Tax=Soonwooa buanensis TaxID=619805 RepID=A0A1T5GGC0_9FLAO|nr:hypothetical protein [Soonwooa buanensis]SKC07484.1 Antitoxin component YwqK of the YwqJK toxin-antitoxin module [Soonwooa buanensis]
MKRLIFIFLILSFKSLAFAQKEHKRYYSNGKLEESGQFDANEKAVGEWKYYYEEGNIERIETYDGDKVFAQSFWKNGKKHQISTSQNGYFLGTSLSYYENGQPWSIKNFVNGSFDGMQKSFYSNGKLEYIGFYKKGMRVGKWEYFHENGKRSIVATYDNDKNLSTDWYRDDGTPWKKEKNDYSTDGKLTVYFEEYHLNGKLERTGSFFEGVEVGIWEYYDEKGKLIERKEK